MEEKQYNIIVYTRAANDLARLLDYVSVDNQEYAKKLKNMLIEGIKSLSFFPERCPFLIGEFIPYNKYHKFIINGRYLIIFQIKLNTVYVEYIIDTRQDYQWLIR